MFVIRYTTAWCTIFFLLINFSFNNLMLGMYSPLCREAMSNSKRESTTSVEIIPKSQKIGIPRSESCPDLYLVSAGASISKVSRHKKDPMFSTKPKKRKSPVSVLETIKEETAQEIEDNIKNEIPRGNRFTQLTKFILGLSSSESTSDNKAINNV